MESWKCRGLTELQSSVVKEESKAPPPASAHELLLVVRSKEGPLSMNQEVGQILQSDLSDILAPDHLGPYRD